jgi:hypothetical protein
VPLLCEGLEPYGVGLVPAGDQSAILHNQASEAIASMAFIWTFAHTGGRVRPHSFPPGTGTSGLLPFGLDERMRKILAYRNTIFPGSKRVMHADGSISGDNSDVRPPQEDEVWRGGWVGFGGGSTRDELEPLKLELDGVFFADGAFAGPNRLGSWDRTVIAAQAHRECAALVRRARESGSLPSDVFSELQAWTGAEDEKPPPPPPPWSFESGPPDPEPVQRHERHFVGWKIQQMRRNQGDERTIAAIAAWAEAPVPNFRRL